MIRKERYGGLGKYIRVMAKEALFQWKIAEKPKTSILHTSLIQCGEDRGRQQKPNCRQI